MGWDLVPAEQGLCTTTLSCFSRGFAPHPTALSCVPKPASGPSPRALGHKGSGTANTRLTSPPGGLHRAPEQSPTSRPGHAGAASPPPCAKEAEVQQFIPALPVLSPLSHSGACPMLRWSSASPPRRSHSVDAQPLAQYAARRGSDEVLRKCCFPITTSPSQPALGTRECGYVVQ